MKKGDSFQFDSKWWKDEGAKTLPKSGLTFAEFGNLTEILCKPKIMPLKSTSLLKLEQMEKELQQALKKKAVS